jgi:hypothetical protein
LAKLQTAPLRVEQGRMEQQQSVAELQVPAVAERLEQPGAPVEQQALAGPRAQLRLKLGPAKPQGPAAWQRAHRHSPEAQQVAAEQPRAAQLVSRREPAEPQARQQLAAAQASTLARTWLLPRPLQRQPHP